MAQKTWYFSGVHKTENLILQLFSWPRKLDTSAVFMAQKTWYVNCFHGLFVLRFYGPVNPIGLCRARSGYLTTRLLGRLSPLSVNRYCAHSFARNWQLPFLNQRKGDNDRRKYFMINLHERMLPTSAGVEPATSWSPVGRRIQLSHRGRQLFSWPRKLDTSAVFITQITWYFNCFHGPENLILQQFS